MNIALTLVLGRKQLDIAAVEDLDACNDVRTATSRLTATSPG